MAAEIFTADFLEAVQLLVSDHHRIYPRLPPQGLFLEALTEQAFRLAGWHDTEVIATTPNSPQHDLAVAGVRLSIKSETGKVTKADQISITKLCTTEKGKWTTEALAAHVMSHIQRYDRMLMLRAIWQECGFDYQLVEIPLVVLLRIGKADLDAVGVRTGRRSIAGDVMDGTKRVFRVHFDGADGKCQISALRLDACHLLRYWQQPIP